MQFVTFGLAGETYGLEINRIQEIIMDKEITRVPNLASFLKGIINLRNLVIPVVEGTERLGYDPEISPEYGEGRIMIVEYENQLIGIRINSADTVLTVDPSEIQSSPEIIGEMGGRFVKGVVEHRSGGRRDSSDRGTGSSGGRIDQMEIDVTSSGSRVNRSQGESKGLSSSSDNEDLTNILLLDLDELFTGEEIQEIQQASESGTDPS